MSRSTHSTCTWLPFPAVFIHLFADQFTTFWDWVILFTHAHTHIHKERERERETNHVIISYLHVCLVRSEIRSANTTPHYSVNEDGLPTSAARRNVWQGHGASVGACLPVKGLSVWECDRAGTRPVRCRAITTTTTPTYRLPRPLHPSPNACYSA